MKSVSVVMATYQGEQHLREQLDSILVQSVRPDEIVVVDDGSTDSTRAILAAYATREPSLRVLFNDRTLGVNRNFEKGARAATGDIVFFSDQDDIWIPNKIETMLAEIESRPDYDLYYSDAAVVDAKGEVICASEFEYHGVSPVVGKPLISFFYSNCVSGHNVAVPRQLIERALPFAENVLYDQWLALVASAARGVACIPHALAQHRIHNHNAHNNAALRRARKKRKFGLFSKYHRMCFKATQRIALIDNILSLEIDELDRAYLVSVKQFFENYPYEFLGWRYRQLLESRSNDVFSISAVKGSSRSAKIKRMSRGGFFYRLYLL